MFERNSLSPALEERRLAALYSYDILGDELESELDNLVKLAAQIANVPMAYVSFVDRENVILRSSFGIGNEYRVIPRNLTVCEHTMLADRIVVIPDVKAARLNDHESLLTQNDSVNFYASAPLVDDDGYALGCLSLLDREARQLDQNQIKALETLGVQVIAQLTLKRKHQELLAETERAEEFVNMFKVSPEIHCVLNRDGDILFINDAVTTLVNYSVEETIGKNMWQFCYAEDVERVVGLIQNGLKNQIKQFSVDFRLVDKKKQIKWIGWSMVSKGDKWYCYGRDITENKQTEIYLTQLSLVASKVNNGVVISDKNNQVTWVNSAFEDITGYNLTDLQGKSWGDLIAGPETDWSVIENARNLIKEKKSFSVDIPAYTKSKQKIWLSVYSTVILDDNGQVANEVEIIIDITSKKEIEQEIEVLSLVASKTNNGVAICNKDGEITWVNHSLEKLIGYELSELSGKMLGDVLSTEETEYEVIKNSREKAKNKEAYAIEVQVNKKDGCAIWLSVSNTPIINNEGEVERQIEIIDDITQRKQVEREMVLAREQALQLSEAKEMFLSVMSHEIRTPLNAVIGMTHLLLDNDPKVSQLNDLNILKFSGENLLNIINDILDFTKIETGNLQLESIPFGLKPLCNDIIQSLQVDVEKKNNSLEFDYDENIPETLLGDKTRLYQVLMNLLGNAIKFTTAGKISLKINLRQRNADAVDIYFEVKDTGIGIPSDKQEYIFETFTQAKTDISRKYGGTGLGLAITKKLLKLYQSDIGVDSIEGQGTKFSFEIKFKMALSSLKSQEEAKPAVFKGKKILVVDDNDINILIAKRIFGKWGLLMDFASNGHEAIELITNNIYDLVFMDIKMPGIDGFETTIIVRSIEGDYYKNLPIIALTASTLHNEERKFKESGMNGHILKPFNPEEIKQALARLLKK